MSVIHHINPEGESKPCGGQMKGGNCKWPNQPHFDSKEKADQAAEKLKKEKYGAVPATTRKTGPSEAFEKNIKEVHAAVAEVRAIKKAETDSYEQFRQDLAKLKNKLENARLKAHPNADEIWKERVERYKQEIADRKIEQLSYETALTNKYYGVNGAKEKLTDAQNKLLREVEPEDFKDEKTASVVYDIANENYTRQKHLEGRLREIVDSPYYRPLLLAKYNGIKTVTAATGVLRIPSNASDEELKHLARNYDPILKTSTKIMGKSYAGTVIQRSGTNQDAIMYQDSKSGRYKIIDTAKFYTQEEKERNQNLTMLQALKRIRELAPVKSR